MMFDPYDFHDMPLRHASEIQLETFKMLLHGAAAKDGFAWDGNIWHDEVHAGGAKNWTVFSDGELCHDLMFIFGEVEQLDEARRESCTMMASSLCTASEILRRACAELSRGRR